MSSTLVDIVSHGTKKHCPFKSKKKWMFFERRLHTEKWGKK